MRKIAIMQPYFFPYIGYFQLMNLVDEFIVYDNIEFTKKGWINRNRILVSGKDAFITIPLKNDSDYLHIMQRFLADTWPVERKKMLNRLIESYRKAPCFEEVYKLVEKCIMFDDRNLFNFIFNSLNIVNDYLGIQSDLIISSTIPIDHNLKAEKKVIEICKARNSDFYLNPIGGQDLYNKEDFIKEGIDLHFLKSGELIYEQFKNDFVPWLSIIDVLMFNPKDKIKNYLDASYSFL